MQELFGVGMAKGGRGSRSGLWLAKGGLGDEGVGPPTIMAQKRYACVLRCICAAR